MKEHDVEVLNARASFKLNIDASADPYAPGPAANGKAIYTPQQAGDNLMRNDVDWTQNSYGALDDGVLTYGFWTYEQFLDSYFFELRFPDGSAVNDDAFYAETYGAFEAFTAAQAAAASKAIELWDDLMDVQLVQVAAGGVGDIMFGAVYMSPAAGAHAYYPQPEALNDFYGTTNYGDISGDVMINWLYNSPTGADGRPVDDSFSDLAYGSYANFTLVHELGHSFGLAHGGDYNASDDNDGDGVPDPITYANDAYFYQDSQQYTIMSYFAGRVTGQGAIDWDRGQYVMTQTPAVHDIVAVHNTYGADTTTRTGNTVYGFNSTADKAIFDFTQNKIPMLTIMDAGGKDTLDLSGFNTNSEININEGEFSTAGYKITAAQKTEWMGILGLATEAQWQSWLAARSIGSDGNATNNISIAYGTMIENAVGGVGNDKMIGNALNNSLNGGAGDDILNGGAGKDDLTGGSGADKFVFTDLSKDKITDFDSGVDKIDLTAFASVDAADIKLSGANVFADTNGDGKHDLHIVLVGEAAVITDIMFA